MTNNPFTQSPEYFNQAIAYVYLNPEIEKTTNSILLDVQNGNINVSDINQSDFPDNLNSHLFISQNINNIDLYALNNAIKQYGELNNALFDNMISYLPIFQTKLQIQGENFFKAVGYTFNEKHIGIGSVVKIKTSFAGYVTGSVIYMDAENLLIETNSLDIIIPVENETYTLHSVQTYDIVRIAYIVYFRQFLSSTPNVIYDTQVEFNYDLYISLYPDAKSMNKDEAYLDYIYYLGINDARIGKATDIAINGESLPSMTPLDPLAQADLDTDVVRVRKVLNVPDTGLVSFHGVDLFYTSSNDQRHSRDVKYSGLITEHAIKAYVDHKFDDYADMNTLNVIGEAAFNKNVYMRGDSNFATYLEVDSMLIKKNAVLQNLETIDFMKVRGSLTVDSNINALASLVVGSNINAGGSLSVKGVAVLDSNLFVQNDIYSDNINIVKDVNVMGTIRVGSDISIAPSNIKTTNAFVEINNGDVVFDNSSVTMNNSNLVLNNNKLVIDSGELSLINSSVATIPVLEIEDSLVVQNGAPSELGGNVVFKGSGNSSVFEQKVTFNNTISSHSNVVINKSKLSLLKSELYVESNNSSFINGNITIEQGSILINRGNVAINSNNISIDNGDIRINTGGVAIQTGAFVVGNNIIRNNGITLDSSSIDVINGYVNVNEVFFVDSENIVAEVPFIADNIVVNEGIVTLNHSKLYIPDGGDIYAPLSYCEFNKVELNTLIGCNIYAMNAMESATMKTSNLNAYTLVVSDSVQLGNALKFTKSNGFFSIPIEFKSGLTITGSQNINGDLKLSNLLTAKNINASCNIETSSLLVKGFSTFESNALFNSNVNIYGKTTFYGKIDFRNPMYFSAPINFYDKIQCFSNVTFNSTCAFKSETQFINTSTFNKANFESDVNILRSGVSFDDEGMTVSKIADIDTAFIYKIINNTLECTNQGSFKGSTDFSGGVRFTGPVTMTNNVSITKPMYLTGVTVGSNFISTDSMSLFKKTVYIDETLVSSNISIQNQGFVRNLTTEVLQVNNFKFMGDLMDIKNDLVVRRNAILNACTVTNNAKVNGGITVLDNSDFYRNVSVLGTLASDTVLNANDIYVKNNAKFDGIVNVNNTSYFKGNVILQNSADFLGKVIFRNGCDALKGTFVFGSSTLLQSTGRTEITDLYIDKIGSCKVANIETLNVDKTMFVNSDLFINGGVFPYSVKIKTDITSVQNVYAENIVSCKQLDVSNRITTLSLNTVNLTIPNRFLVNNINVECLIPLKTRTIDAYDFCTFHKGISVDFAFTVNTQSVFREIVDFQKPVLFLEETQFLKNIIFKSDVTIRKDMYVDGSLYLSQDINLQRDITVQNLKALCNVDVKNLTTTEKAVVNDHLTVHGISYMPRIGIGAKGNFVFTAASTSNVNITCAKLNVIEEATFNKKVTIGVNVVDATLLKVNGNIEATRVVQLSDERTKFKVTNVGDDAIYAALEKINLKYFNKIVDDKQFIGFIAQDLEKDALLNKILVRDGENIHIPLMENRYCRNVSVNNNIIKISDGKAWFFAKGQTLVLNDSRQFNVLECDETTLQAKISPPLDFTDECITITGLYVNDLLKIDQSQLLSLTMGMCASLLRRIQNLEKVHQKSLSM